MAEYFNIQPIGPIDGSNAVFTVPSIPVLGTVQLYRNGLRQTPGGVDYTISATAITLVIVPGPGDNLVMDYEGPAVVDPYGVNTILKRMLSVEHLPRFFNRAP